MGSRLSPRKSMGQAVSGSRNSARHDATRFGAVDSARVRTRVEFRSQTCQKPHDGQKWYASVSVRVAAHRGQRPFVAPAGGGAAGAAGVPSLASVVVFTVPGVTHG